MPTADARASGDQSASQQVGYIPELDGLRALACVMVMLFHSAPDGIFSGGFIGVDIFFVLSGYLITSILTGELRKNRTIRLGQFYLQRSLRLIPALLLFLAAYLAVAPFIWPGHDHVLDTAVAAVYASDYAYPFAQIPFYIRHSWSLAVEEQFYLLWPLVLPFVFRMRHALAAIAVAWIGFTLWRLSFAGGDWVAYYYRFDTHCTGLLAGAALAVFQQHRPVSFSGALGVAALGCIVMISFVAHIGGSASLITLVEICSVIVIGCIASGRFARFSGLLRSKAMTGVGKLSYGLYLWHFPVSYYFRQDSGFLVSALATFAISFAGASLSYFTVEKWGRAMKARARLRADGGDLPAVARAIAPGAR